MKINTSLFKIEIEWLLLTTIIVSIFSYKVKNYLSNYFICYIFILFHEMAHMFIGTICGAKVSKLKLSLAGVNVSFDKNIKNLDISKLKKILIYLAGPISNFILASVFNNIKIVYEINIFLGILNLMPIYPLDGYNILKIINSNCNNKVQKIIFILFIIISMIQIMLYKMFSFALFTLYLFLLSKMNKKCLNLS